MATKVILRQDVAGLGKAGDVKQVKEGYARNFLLPRNLAQVASDHAIQQVLSENKKREARTTQQQKRAQELAEKLKGVSLTLAVEVNEEDKLYGSLNEQDIVQALAAEGVDVDKKMVVLEAPIKSLGIFDVPVNPGADVSAVVKVWVVKK